MRKYKINEIFYSLQGEGRWTGTPIIFIRFSGCNIKCSFCDTKHESYIEMSLEQILNNIKNYPTKHICLTGGEPTLQIDKSLIDALHTQNKYIHIETNGLNKVVEGIDWITVSPKSNTPKQLFAHELKVVYQGQDISIWNNYNAHHLYLQPCSMQNTQEVIAIIKQHPQWKLSAQMHKLLDIP